MKNLSILISKRFFFGLASLWEAKQNISHIISFILIIIDVEVVSRELLGLADLTRAYVFHIHELIEVVIVNKDKDLIFIILQVVAPSLKSLNNGWKFLIMSLILHLYKKYFLRKKGYWVPLANLGLKEIRMNFVVHVIVKRLIQNHLTKDSTNSIP